MEQMYDKVAVSVGSGWPQSPAFQLAWSQTRNVGELDDEHDESPHVVRQIIATNKKGFLILPLQ